MNQMQRKNVMNQKNKVTICQSRPAVPARCSTGVQLYQHRNAASKPSLEELQMRASRMQQQQMQMLHTQSQPANVNSSGDLHFGPDGISIPSPGEPDMEVKDFFWCCAAVAVAALGFGGAVWLFGRDK